MFANRKAKFKIQNSKFKKQHSKFKIPLIIEIATEIICLTPK